MLRASTTGTFWQLCVSWWRVLSRDTAVVWTDIRTGRRSTQTAMRSVESEVPLRYRDRPISETETWKGQWITPAESNSYRSAARTKWHHQGPGSRNAGMSYIKQVRNAEARTLSQPISIQDWKWRSWGLEHNYREQRNTTRREGENKRTKPKRKNSYHMQMEGSSRRTLFQTLRSCPLDSLFNFPLLPDWSTNTQPRPHPLRLFPLSPTFWRSCNLLGKGLMEINPGKK